MGESIYIRNTNIKITDVLDLIAKGYLYNSILYKYPNLSINDIMAVAQTAKNLVEILVSDDKIEIDYEILITAHKGKIVNLNEIRKEFPRAFEKWRTDEDNLLVKLYKDRVSITKISIQMQRQVGAIIARLKKFELMK